MKEFKINRYLSLKLEENKTVIYVANQRFQSCRYLLLNIERDDIRRYDDFKSIDAVAKFYSKKHEQNKHILDPETEFWGHCSNLQAWAEHEYDTHLLDKKLAFPLLKRLTDVGDSIAKKAFKEEIARRLQEKSPSVRKYLIQQSYVDYLNEDELSAIDCKWVEYKGDKIPIIDNSLYLSEELIRDLSEVKDLFKFDSLECLDLGINLLKHIPRALRKLSSLEILNLEANRLTEIPEWLGDLSQLKKLSLAANNISHVPESIANLTSLRSLNLELNKISTLPNSFRNLRSLESLNLGYNDLTDSPSSISNLESLKELNLRGNNLRTLPEFLTQLGSLKKLNVSDTSLDLDSFRFTHEKRLLKTLEESGVKIINKKDIYYSALGFIF